MISWTGIIIFTIIVCLVAGVAEYRAQRKGQTMNNVELIKVFKFADNDFRASAIATGCKLWELKTEGEKLARVRLYRDWRMSKIYGKETKPCFEMACKGIEVPVTDIEIAIDEATRWNQLYDKKFPVPFTDPTPATDDDTTAAYHGQESGAV